MIRNGALIVRIVGRRRALVIVRRVIVRVLMVRCDVRVILVNARVSRFSVRTIRIRVRVGSLSVVLIFVVNVRLVRKFVRLFSTWVVSRLRRVSVRIVLLSVRFELRAKVLRCVVRSRIVRRRFRTRLVCRLFRAAVIVPRLTKRVTLLVVSCKSKMANVRRLGRVKVNRKRVLRITILCLLFPSHRTNRRCAPLSSCRRRVRFLTSR